MSEVTGIGRNSTVTEKGTKVVDSGNKTDKDLFLKLLVAQMTNQDPFNTQDPTQYVTQLAQFNMLEQTMALNDSMEYLIGMTNGLLVNSAMGSASALIGKDVEVYVPKEEGYDTTKTMSGKVESVHIKDGVVYMNVRNSENGELVEVEYGALTKVKGTNTNVEEDNKGE